MAHARTCTHKHTDSHVMYEHTRAYFRVHIHRQTHIINTKTQLTPEKKRVYSGDGVTVAGNTGLGLPKFHVPIRKPFHKVFIGTEKLSHR